MIQRESRSWIEQGDRRLLISKFFPFCLVNNMLNKHCLLITKILDLKDFEFKNLAENRDDHPWDFIGMHK